MDYDSYKQRILKINNVKNKVLKFKWLILGFIAAIVATISTISIVKGSISNIDLSSTYTYGDTIDIKATASMSNVLKYEYKEASSNEWSETKPYKVGSYEVRVITEGLFSNKTSKSYSFEIIKKNLEINVSDLSVKYGEEPEYNTTGLVLSDSLNTITFNYSDTTKNSTLVNLELNSVSIIDLNGLDVTSNYNITSNASNGKEITFTPLELILSPSVSNKEYDGIAVDFNNTYTILNNKETGYNDIICVETSYLKDGKSITNPTDVGDYQVKIDRVLINSLDKANNQNYSITTEISDFSITKRKIEVTTETSTKNYDGTALVDNNYIYTYSSLAETDKATVINNNSSILNYGNSLNKFELSITNESNTDVTSNYDITYKYGTLSIEKKSINIKTFSDTKVYDSTSLSNSTFTNSDLIGDDYLSVIVDTVTNITDAGSKPNYLAVEAYTKDGVKSNNYSFSYEYGTLSITKAPITIEPLVQENKIFNGSSYSNPTNQDYKLVSGTFYNNELKYVDLTYSNNLFNNCSNVGTYTVSINRRDDLTNYDITYKTTSFEITKANVTIKPIDLTQTFSYENVIPSSINFEVIDGTFYNNDRSQVTLNYNYSQEFNAIDNMYHAGTYTINITSINDLSGLINNNYTITYNPATCVIKPKDVSINITSQSAEYQKKELSVDTTLIDSTDESIKNSIVVSNHHTSDTLLNSNTYTIYLDSYNFIDTDTYKQSDFNITVLTSTFKINKREVEIKVSEQESTIYNGQSHQFNTSEYIASKNSFCDGDTIEVSIKDINDKTIKNADTYNLLIDTYSDNLNDNYIITISNEVVEYNIDQFDVNVTLEKEEYVYDGLVHTPNTNFTLDNELFNNDSINLNVTTDNKVLDAGTYEKKATEESVNFICGNDLDSVKSNYKFNITTNYITITKRSISIKLNELSQYYYAPLSDSDYLQAQSYLSEDDTMFGVASIDTLEISKSTYDSLSANELRVGTYETNIEGFDITRYDSVTDTTSSVKDLNYEITLVSSTLTVNRRPVTIKAIDQTYIYSKEYHTYDDTNKLIYDYNDSNNVLDSLPDNTNYTINAHFEYDSKNYDKIIDAHRYDVVIDSINEDLTDYEISYENGIYVINQLPITIKVKDIELTYDGLYHTPEVNQEIEYLSDNQFIDCRVEYELDETYSWKDAYTYYYLINITNLINTSTKLELADYEDLLSNYDITYNYSKYTIIEREIYIELNDQVSIYNGLEYIYDTTDINILDSDSTTLIKDVSDVMYNELVGVEVNVFYNKTPINAGTYTISIDSLGTVKNYIINNTKRDKTLTINKRKLVAAFNNVNVEYDGKNHNLDFNYTIIKDEDQEVERDNYTGFEDYGDILLKYSLTNIDVINVKTYTIELLSYDFGNNLDVSFNNTTAKYTINKRHIIIKPECLDDLTYNGLSQTLENAWTYDDTFTNYDASLETLDHNNIEVVLAEVNDLDIINANTYTIKIKSYTENNNYDVETLTNTIVVKRRDQLIYTVDQESITYDALEHSYNNKYRVYDCLTDTYLDNLLYDNTSLSITKALFSLNNVSIGSSVIDANTYQVIISEYENTSNLDNFNIIISDTYATFTINKHEIVLKLEELSKVYDGKSVRGTYTTDIKILNDLPEEISSYNVFVYYYINDSIYTSITNAQTYITRINSINKLINNASKNVTNNYSLTSIDSTYTISQRKLFVDIKDYDTYFTQEAYTNEYPNYSIKDSDDNLITLYNTTLDVSYYLDNEKVDAIDCNKYLVKINSINVSDLDNQNNTFDISDTATLTIIKAIIYVTATKSELNMSYGNSIDLNKYITLSSTLSGTISATLTFKVKDSTEFEKLDAGSYEIHTENIIDSSVSRNSTIIDSKNYTIEFIDDSYITLNIKQRDISLSFTTYTKEYDACDIDINNISYEFAKLPSYEYNKDGDSILTISSITYKDSSNNIYDTIFHAGKYYYSSVTLYSNVLNKDVTNNYKISVSKSLVAEISKRAIDVTINLTDSSSIYNGYVPTINYTYVTNNAVDGDNLTYSYSFDKYMVGTYSIPFSFTLVSTTNNSLESDYSLDKEVSYTIEKAPLTITSNDIFATYDGYNHSDNTVKYDGLAETDSITAESQGFVNAGTYDNVLTYNITHNSNKDVTNCYNITTVFGKVTIVKRLVTVELLDRELPYSDSDVSDIYTKYNLYDSNNNTITIPDLIVNVEYYQNDAKVEHVKAQGTYLVKIKSIDSANLLDLSNNEFIYTSTSYLTIIKVLVKVNTSQTSFTYTYGDYFDLNNYLSYESELKGTVYGNLTFNVDGTSDLTLLDVGSYTITTDNIISSSLYCNDELINENDYEIKLVEDITITVNKRDITLSFTTYTKEYDAKKLTIDNLSYSFNNLSLYDGSLKLSSISYKDSTNEEYDTYFHAGEYYYLDSYLFSDILGKEVTDNYNITVDNNLVANIKQLSLDVTITLDSYSKTYDGIVPTINYTYVTNNALVGDIFTYSHSFNEYVAGSYSIPFNFTLDSTTNNSLDSDYSLNKKVSYTIGKAPLTITSNDINAIYDGNTHIDSTGSAIGLVSTDTISYISNGFIDAIENGTNSLGYTIKHSGDNVTVNDCYKVSTNYGVVNIYKRSIKFESLGFSAPYTKYQEYYNNSFNVYVTEDDKTVSLYSLTDSKNTFNINDSKDFSITRYDINKLYQAGKTEDTFKAYIYLNNSNASANFDITYSFDDKYVEVSKQNLTINVESTYSKEYDGKKLDLSKLISSEKEYDNSDKVSINTYTIIDSDNSNYDSILYANTYTFTLSSVLVYAKDDSNKDVDVTNSYNITYNTNTSKVFINKVELIITTDSETFYYNGDDKKYESLSIIRKDNSKSYSYPLGKATYSYATLYAYDSNNNKLLSNSCENTVEITLLDGLGNSLLNNYIITYNYGTLSFYTDYSIKYLNHSSKYSGSTLDLTSVNDALVFIDNSKITGYTASFDILDFYNDEGNYSTIQNVGTYYIDLNKDTFKILVNGIEITYDELLNCNCSVDFNLQYTIEQLNLLAEIDTTYLDYNGSEQTIGNNITYTLIENDTLDYNSLILGHTLVLNSTLSGTTPGYYGPSAIDSYNVYDSENNDVTINYNLLNLDKAFNNNNKYKASLYINYLKLNVKYEGPTSFTYDGSEHYVNITNLDEIKEEVAKNNHSVDIARETDYCSFKSLKITDSKGLDVTSYYTGYPYVYINKCIVKVDCTNIFTFNGEEHSIIINNSSDVDYIIKETNNQTYSLNPLTNEGITDPITVHDSKNNDVTSNYSFTDLNGGVLKLLVQRSSILVLDTTTTSFTYDGSAHSLTINNILDIEKIIKANGHTYKLNELTNVDMVDPITIYDEDHVDITSNYQLKDTNGSYVYLEVVECEIVVDVVKDTFTYNGSEQNINISNYSKIEDIVKANGDTLSYRYLTNVDSDIPFTVTNQDGEDVTDNYSFKDYDNYNVYLTIEELEVEVNVVKNSYTYDGISHKVEVSNYNAIKSIVNACGDTIEYRYLTDYDSDYPFIIKNSDGEDVSDNYRFIDTDYNLVYLTINQCDVLIKASKFSFVYDGKAHSLELLNENSIKDIIESTNNQTYSLVSIIDVDSTTPLKVLDKNGVDVTDNYNFIMNSDYDTAYLSVTYPSDLVLDVNTNSYTYDGKEHSISITSDSYSKIEEILYANSHFIYDNYLTDVDSVEPFTIKDVNGNDVTDNYNFVDSNGYNVYLEVTQRKVVVNTSKSTFIYDGKGHSIEYSSLTNTISGYTFTAAKEVEVGSYDPFTVTNSNGLDTTDNFYFVNQNGSDLELIITYEIPNVVLDGYSSLYEYNGQSHTIDINNKNSISSYLIKGHRLELVSKVNVGEYKNVIIIYDEYDNDVTSYYNFVDTNGSTITPTLTIYKKSITIETVKSEFVYDGLEHSITIGNELELKNSLCSGHTYKLNTLTSVGSINPITIYDSKGKDVTDNYSMNIKLTVKSN